jgi:transposase
MSATTALASPCPVPLNGKRMPSVSSLHRSAYQCATRSSRPMPISSVPTGSIYQILMLSCGPAQAQLEQQRGQTAKAVTTIAIVERGYCRLKDFRRVATRYDKLARNNFSTVCLTATVMFWL